MKKSLKIGLSFTTFVFTMLFVVVFSFSELNNSSEVFNTSADKVFNMTTEYPPLTSKIRLDDVTEMDSPYYELDTMGNVTFRYDYQKESWKIYDEENLYKEHRHDSETILSFKAYVPGKIVSVLDGVVAEFKANDILIFEQNKGDSEYDDWTINGILVEANDEKKGYDLEFATSRPAISGDAVIANVDKPYTLEQIKTIANLKAIDPYFGDISDDIEIESETYTNNSSKVGTWEINYFVINGAGLRTDFKLLVPTKDLTGPLINGPANATHSYTDELTEQDILSKFTITDNTDSSPVITLNNGGYAINKIGTFNMVITAVDKYNNKTTKSFTLIINDDQAPTYVDENPGTVQLSYTDSFTDAKLLLGLTATDFIDGDLTDFIKVVSNPLKAKLGLYTVKYEVKDKAGNTGYFEKEFEVITTDHPEFFVGSNVINIEDINKLTIEELINFVAQYENFDFVSFEVTQDEYTGTDAKGRYNLKAVLTNAEGETLEVARVINVFNRDDLSKNATLTFWEKTVRLLKKIWEGIKTFFGWIWTGIKFIWKYTLGGLFKLIGKLFTTNALMLFLSL